VPRKQKKSGFGRKEPNGWIIARPIAHRGLHDIKAGTIENSRSGFELAAQHNFAIECDVQLTRDGEAVVFHDYSLERLTFESGEVITRTAAELARMTLRSSIKEDSIATLDQLMTQINGRVPVVVEIKSRFDGDLRLTRRVAEVLSGIDAPVAIKSFDPRIVAALRMMVPDRPRGIVAMAAYDYPDYVNVPADEKRAMANLLHFSEMQPDFISWHVKDLPHAAPHLCRVALGLPVMTWTVRTADDVSLANRYADQMVFEGFIPD
jgi:glycerophosphoryl diester phosphodiesterase